MAYEINYGNGSLGNLDISDGAFQDFNSYARILKIEQNTITLDLDNLIEGKFNTFNAGVDVLIHFSATSRATCDALGKFLIAKITLIQNGVATLDKDVESFFSGVNFDFDFLQAITIPDFNSVKLGNGAVITCPPFNPFNYIGGILIVRCWNDLIFDGGSIKLTDCGIPANRKNALRPLTTQETAANGESDFAKMAGLENFITSTNLLLNAGDGACMLIAKKLILAKDSQIGTFETHGAAYCRGHSTSVGIKPSNITNIGGSSIFIAADSIENFTPNVIAKYRRADLPAGKGLCRCYIASNSSLPADEGLYSKDILSNPARVRNFGIENFGSGNFGDLSNPTAPLNNYAKITAINGFRLSYTNKTLNGLAPLRKGALVMLHVIQNKLVADSGKFIIARILNDSDSAFVIDKKFDCDLDNYLAQIISIPEFDNLTINQNYTATPKFNGVGGVLAVSVNDTFNLENGSLNVEGKGGAIPYGRAGLNYISNSQMFNRLPLGAGHGSVFVLAKKLILNENSRLGATYSGANVIGGSNSDGTNAGGGYAGAYDENGTGSGGGFIGGGGYGGLGGSAMAGATSSPDFDFTAEIGGYGSNGSDGLQGAHLMIIADKIEGFSQAAISTGGSAAKGAVSGRASQGGGGNSKDSGGSGAFAFIYTNAI